MVLKDIMAISGQPGLFRFIAQGKNAIIVEHLETKKRSSAFSSSRVSSLDEISIFTEGEDMPLGKVFDRIHEKENGGPAIDSKSDPEKLKSWFADVLPEYNREKVYVSDIKKIAQWYNLLHNLNLLIMEEPEKSEDTEKQEEEVVSGGADEVKASSEEDPEKVNKKKVEEKAASGQKSRTGKQGVSARKTEDKNKPDTEKENSGTEKNNTETDI